MHNRRITGRTVLLALILAVAPAFSAGPVAWTVQPGQVTGQVDVEIYGQFLEHIFNVEDSSEDRALSVAQATTQDLDV
jgi:hypothetical protein